jgi:hypothetical protein
MPSVMTPGGLAKRMVELYWPLAAPAAGFAHPDEPPVFLTLESSQYFMARIASPLLDAGRFESLVIDQNRLYSQVIDNLNKAAFVGFPHTEFAQRLISAGTGERLQRRIYEDAQECALLFRRYCLENNLLDFSLQLEIFKNCLWPSGPCRDWLVSAYRHLIFDNIEEETPFTFDLIQEWLPSLESALLIYDWDAGYRRFLGADPDLTFQLKEACSDNYTLDGRLAASPALSALEGALPYAFKRASASEAATPSRADYQPALDHHETPFRFHNEMVDWAAAKTAELVSSQETSPGEIVILAPYMPDSLRFSLTDRLLSLGIPVRSHRPSRSLREEPPARCMLTLAALAHPAWGFHPSRFDVAYALVQAVDGMDLVRAQLLAEIVYRERPKSGPVLSPFDGLASVVQERITYLLGQRYDRLRTWLEAYAAGKTEEIDYFFCRLFGEVLSQPGFRFHHSYALGETAAHLVDSAAAFRQAISACPQPEGALCGKEYLQMVQEGVIAATYAPSWTAAGEEVTISPAYTFLLSNRPVDVQFWLDLPSKGWGERVEQPLTHPYVLSRSWPEGAKWTDDDEYQTGQEALYRLVTGLVRCCRRKIYLGMSVLNEQGYEQQGPLQRVFQRLLAS